DPFFKNFTTYDNLKTTLQFWCKNSQGWCNFIPVYGRSYEGRDLFGAIVTNPAVNQNKTYVWINAGLDGSSTLAPTTAAYMVRALIYDSYYPDIADLLQKYSFVFTPMANPDGFEYSRKNKVAWKKNRSIQKAGNFGVDLTRNFDDHFCQFGGSTNPKDTNYCGPKAFSEPETYYLLQFARKLQRGLWSVLDMYDGGQMLARAPAWSYTYTMNNAIEKGITDGMGIALQQAGYSYSSVVASEKFGLNSGSLLDFVELQLHAPSFRLYL
ncbi:Zn-dependent exopeptidase, partial [Conidiobolus coronatus NRRL 28638]